MQEVKIHRANERGKSDLGWLQSRFSFSFAEYYNPQRKNFGVLRVINDDVIHPGKGFDMHPHNNMEIITIVTEGIVEHKDSEGNHGQIKKGEIQYMSAGEGILHSEYNPSLKQKTRLFQIWIYPRENGGVPRYENKEFLSAVKKNQWITLVSGEKNTDAIEIKQDAKIQYLELGKGNKLKNSISKSGMGRLLFLIEGEIRVNNEILHPRDEIQIVSEKEIEIQGVEDSIVLLFEVPLN